MAPNAETVARYFHEAYERLAPSFGYETRKDSAVPWDDVPEPNRSLMVAVAAEVLAHIDSGGRPPARRQPLRRDPLRRAGPDYVGRLRCDLCGEWLDHAEAHDQIVEGGAGLARGHRECIETEWGPSLQENADTGALSLAIYRQPSGSFQLNIEDGSGGYRLIGPTFDGTSQLVVRHAITAWDAAVITKYLDEMPPIDRNNRTANGGQSSDRPIHVEYDLCPVRSAVCDRAFLCKYHGCQIRTPSPSGRSGL